MRLFAVALLGLLTGASALELTPDNWDEVTTTGKAVFIKFFAPWCGHCKKMKPDWDKLMDEFSSSPYVLVAEVDCTGSAKSICSSKGVRGYPSIKWGDPSSLEDYKGGRDFNSLKKFADEKFKPVCSPSDLDLCDTNEKAEIEKFMAMSSADLESAIVEKETKKKEAEEAFNKAMSELEKKIVTAKKEITTTKEETLKEINVSGLGLMKAVMAAKGSSGSEEL